MSWKAESLYLVAENINTLKTLIKSKIRVLSKLTLNIYLSDTDISFSECKGFLICWLVCVVSTLMLMQKILKVRRSVIDVVSENRTYHMLKEYLWITSSFIHFHKIFALKLHCDQLSVNIKCFAVSQSTHSREEEVNLQSILSVSYFIFMVWENTR